MRARQVVVGFGGGAVLLAALVYGVGWQSVVDALAVARPAPVALAAGISLAAFAFRAVALDRLFDALPGALHGPRFYLVYCAGVFLRCVLPWGRTPGTVATAYLLAREGGASFDENVAVLAAYEAIQYVVSLFVVAVGLGAFLAVGTVFLPLGTLAVLAGIVLLGSGVMALAFVARDWLRVVALRVVTAAAVALDWVQVRGEARFDSERARAHVDRFFDTLNSLSAHRWLLVAAVVFTQVSWLSVVVSLYLSLLAIGAPTPMSVCLIVVPVAGYAGVVPLPGGVGSVEVALAGLLTVLGGLPVAVATAGVLLYRVLTFYSHLVVGGVGALVLAATRTPSPRRVD